MTELFDENQPEDIFLEEFSSEDVPFDSESDKFGNKKSLQDRAGDLLKETPAKDWVDSKKFALGSSMLGYIFDSNNQKSG